jgi:hypothetical protein
VAAWVFRVGVTVKARQILSDAALGPGTLNVLFEAFDGAWEQIAPSIGGGADAIEAARIKLANIILALSRNGANDAEQMKNAALQLWSGDPD